MGEALYRVIHGLVLDGTINLSLDLGTIGVSTPSSVGDCHTKVEVWEGLDEAHLCSTLAFPHDYRYDGIQLDYPCGFVGERLKINEFFSQHRSLW